MSDDAKNMTCAEFQAQMPELIGTGEDISAHPHVQSCDLCRELLSELETIAEAARQLFPVADPPDELWDHIKAAIESDTDEVPGGASEAALSSVHLSDEESAARPSKGLTAEPA